MGYNYTNSVTMVYHSTGRNFELVIAIALTAFASMLMVAVSTIVSQLIEIMVMLALVCWHYISGTLIKFTRVETSPERARHF
jgi:ACR3 family arsenite efflux pump ArsB